MLNLFVNPAKLLSQSTIDLESLDPIRPPGGDKPISGLGELINPILKFIYPLGGVVLFFMVIWAAFDIFASQGNAEKIKSAKLKITYAVIGFGLLVLSFLLIKVIAYISGLGDQGL